MLTIQTLWQRLTRPAASIRDDTERQRASLLSALLVAVMLLLLLFFGAGLVFPPPLFTSAEQNLIMISLVLAPALYALSRTRHYRISVWLVVVVPYILIVRAYLSMELALPERALNFLGFVLLMAGLVLPLRATLAVLVWFEITLFALPAIRSYGLYDQFGTAVFVGGIGLLTLLSEEVKAAYKRRAQQSEARYRELLEASTEGILIVDEAIVRILDSNTAFERILGYSHEEALGRVLTDFLGADSISILTEQGHKRKSTPHELQARHKDGHPLPVEVTIRPYTYRERPACVVIVRDISERKQTEQALMLSEQRFRAIFNQSFQFIGLLEPDGTMIEVNETSLRFFGITMDKVIGRPLWEIERFAGSERGAQRLREAVAQAAAGTFVRYEAHVRDRHGIRTTIDFSIKPVYDEQGRVILLIPEGRDITAFKHAEQLRLEYEHRYQSLFTQTTDAVVLIDLSGTLLSVNEQALGMFGATYKEMVGKNQIEFIAESDREVSMARFERLVAGQEPPVVVERRLKRKNGEIFVGEVSVVTVRDGLGQPLYLQSMIRDTTERRRAEQQRFELSLERERTRLLENFIDQASHHFRTPITNIKTSLYLLPRVQDDTAKQTHHFAILQTEIERLEHLLDDLLTVSRLQKDDSEYRIGPVSVKQLLIEVQARQAVQKAYGRHRWQWQRDTDEQFTVVGDKQRLAQALRSILDNARHYTSEGGEIAVRAFRHGAWLVIEVRDSGHGIGEQDLPHIFKDFYRSSAALEQDSAGTGLGLSICKMIVERHQGLLRVASEVGTGTTMQIVLPLLTTWGDSAPPQPPPGLLQPLPDAAGQPE